MKILFVHRDARRGGKSVEEIYKGLFEDLKNTIAVEQYSYQDDIGIWKNIRHIYKESPDVVHISSDMYWISMFLPGIKTVLTIHDIGRYRGLKGLRKWLYKQLYFYIPSICASSIVTVSDFTKKELFKVIPRKANQKIRVIYNPVPGRFGKNPVVPPPGRNVILQVGTSEHKNLESVIKSVNEFPCTLNIIGRLSEGQRGLLDKYSIHFNVFEGLSYEDVYKLYLESDVVTFISRYEGFGMPVIEAQACGRPIIISEEASLPEIAGTGAIYIKDIYNTTEIKLAIESVLTDKTFRTLVINNGFLNIERFSRDKIIGDYLKLYASLK